MKILKKHTASAILGLALIGSVNAETIYLAGSNGDRVATQTAIGHLLSGGSFLGTSSDPTKANFGIWNGSYQGQPITIKVAFIGATGGIAAVAGNKTVKFPTDAKPKVDPTGTGAASDEQVPSFSTSTNFQSTSNFNGKFQGTVYATLQDQLVGVVALKFLATPGFPGTNITTQEAQLLYSTGKVPVSLFTGKKAHQKQTVFAIGRNTDAGQRFGTLAEIGLGFNAVVKQYLPTIAGATKDANGVLVGGVVTSQALWPVEVVSGVDSGTPGNSGFKTGATLAPALTAKLSKTAFTVGNKKAKKGFYIGYLTYADAANIAIPAGAKELAFNGVPYSLNAVREGQYTFWLYTHVLYRKSLSGLPKAFADSLATQIKTVDAEAQGAGFFLNRLFVQRATDGGNVTPTFF